MAISTTSRRWVACCCGNTGGGATCEFCAGLECGVRTGLSITIADVVLSEFSTGGLGSDRPLVWDGGGTINTTVCQWGTGCNQTAFRSLNPVKTGTRDGEEIALYAYARFGCAGLIDAYITGANTQVGTDDGEGPLAAFSTTIEGVSTELPWTPSCTLAGDVISNAITTYGGKDPGNEHSLIGQGGTITTGGDCAGGNCTSCLFSAVTVTFTGGVLDGYEVDFVRGPDGENLCGGFTFGDGTYFGQITIPVLSPYNAGAPFNFGLAGGPPLFRLRVWTVGTTFDDPPIFDGWMPCDGSGEPVVGRYVEEAEDDLGNPINQWDPYVGFVPTVYADVA